MTRLFLAAGVAAIAITAPAASAPGGKHAATDRVERTQTAKAQKARGREARAARVERRSTARAERSEAREGPARTQRAERTQVRERPARVQRQERQAERIQSRPDRATVRAERQAGRTDRSALRTERQAQRQLDRTERVAARDRNVERVRDVNGVVRTRAIDVARGYGVGGCPPGLAKKPVACMPPGQAQKLAPLGLASRNLAAAAILDPLSARRFVGQPLSVLDDTIALNPIPVRLQSIYPSTPQYYYQYGNGYAYRVDRESQLISALLPLFGLGYGVGQPFPTAYSNAYLPSAYQPFYPTSPYSSYRYANGYVYQVDPYTGLIADIDPMLGYGYGYGQMMPTAYSAYNVPYQYRPLYYDTSDYYYRYAPGAIYQVDPTTSLITAVAALLTGGLNVGQPLPVGYSAYNVPLTYRANYYDTPDAWYRYADGYIYRVNPVTGLVTDRVVLVV